MTPRTTASRPASMPLPAWIVALAVAAVLFAVVPIVALTLRVDWPRFPALVTTDASLTALGLSLRTAAISTVLCVVLGVPLALVEAVLAREHDAVMRQDALDGQERGFDL